MPPGGDRGPARPLPRGRGPAAGAPGRDAGARRRLRYHPVFLDLRDRRCVVLGGGELARVKAVELAEAGARVTVVSAEPGTALRELAQAGRLRLEERDYAGGDLRGARLAVDASGDPGVNRASAAEAAVEGVLLNVVDRPELCGYIAPAVVRREPLVLAISTGGESPYAAGAVRAMLERLVGEEWGPFVSLLGRVRRGLRAASVPVEAQRDAFRRLLASDARRLLARGRRDEAEDLAAAAAARAGERAPGRVALVGAGPGDAGLITLAAQDALLRADVVLHDALVGERVLRLAGPEARLVDVGTRGGRRRRDQEATISRMIEEAREGRMVVRLKGGDPFVFGRGGEEMLALLRAGIDVVVIPGVSAAIAAPAAAGIPLTMRGVASSFAVVTGHCGGPSPGDGEPPYQSDLQAVARAVDTLVVLMPLANLEEITARLVPAVGPDRPAALVAGATLEGQRAVRGRLADLPGLAAAAELRSPATMVVGDVVATLPDQP